MTTLGMKRNILVLLPVILLSGLIIPGYDHVLLKDTFSSLDTGLFSAPVGPHTEYHYLPEAGTKG